MDGNTIGKASAVSTIYQQQTMAQQTLKTATPDAERKSAPDATQKDTVQVSSKVTLRNLDTSRAIEQMHAYLNQQAKSVRETNESINKAVDQIDTMRGNLQTIIKNFPPFPIDSKERSEILMGYTSLRKELIRLMVPPPPTPVYEKVQHMWSSLFEGNGQVIAAAIPDLDNRSSDATVKEAAGSLETTSTQLAEFSDKVTQALVNP